MFNALFAFMSTYKLQLLATLGVLAAPALALESLLMSRAAPWLRTHYPRAYAALHALLALSPQLIRFVKMVLAIWRPSLLAQWEAAYLAIMAAVRTAPKPPPLPTFALVLALCGCGAVHSVAVTGTVSSDGGQDWAATVGVTLTFADAVVPAACGVATTSLDVPAADKAAIATACHDATDALAGAEALLGAFRLTRAADASCRLRVGLDALLEHQLALVVLLEDAHVPVPPELPAIVGAVGSFVDALLPACPSDAGAPAPSATRIHAAFARGHGGTR